MDLNQWNLKPGLIWAFCQAAAPTLEWLLTLGVEVPAKLSTSAMEPGLDQGGVGDVWRAHVPLDQGYGLVQVLDRECRSLGVDVVLRTRVQQLIVAAGGVVGVVADGVEVRSGAVVVATGGLSHDPGLLAEHYPRALQAGESLFLVAAPGSRGDHLRMGRQVGAAVAGSGKGLLLLTAYFQRFHHWQAGFPPRSRVYVDQTGRRFVNEDVSYAVSTGIFDDHAGWAWSVFDELARRSLPVGYANWTPLVVHDEAEAGRTKRADTLEELAIQMGVPPDSLVRTIADWNTTLPRGAEDVDFMRHRSLAEKDITDPLDPISEPPFYAVRMLPAELVCTHAGLEINEHAEVIGLDGRPVPGLFAAGEAGGGVLGEHYVGAGNSVANAITMGRIAGLRASRRLVT
jgi:succinate dehydrogenase/fumarate reductase flavoprotein subunit